MLFRKTEDVTGSRIALSLLWVAVLLLTFTCIILASINYWGIQLGSVDYQKFGTWGQAISGTATFLGVMTALSSLLWQYGKSRKEQEQKLIDEQTALYFWLTSQILKEENTGIVLGRQWDVEIQNLTKSPIYRWRLDIDARPLRESLRPILPNQNTFNLPELDNREPSDVPEPYLYFMSRDGRYWKRTASGTLSPIDQIPKAIPS